MKRSRKSKVEGGMQGGSSDASFCPRPSTLDPRSARSAFTLVEMLVVVAIMGLIMAAGIPSLYALIHKEGFRKSLSDLQDVCDAARAEAILQDQTATLVFHPQDGTFEGGGKNGKIEDARIDGLFVNLMEYTAEETATVNFYPNGTCDEMTLILTSAHGDQKAVVLEITTGVATILAGQDLQDYRDGRL